jgi:hypothetical protein
MPESAPARGSLKWPWQWYRPFIKLWSKPQSITSPACQNDQSGLRRGQREPIESAVGFFGRAWCANVPLRIHAAAATAILRARLATIRLKPPNLLPGRFEAASPARSVNAGYRRRPRPVRQQDGASRRNAPAIFHLRFAQAQQSPRVRLCRYRNQYQTHREHHLPESRPKLGRRRERE